MKMDMAMALARKFTGTVSRINVFTGPVPKNNRNIAPAKQAIEVIRSGNQKAPNASGTESTTDKPSTQA